MSQLIIGLGSKARQGKDSFASAIETYYANAHAAAVRHDIKHYKPVVIQRLAFADALYKEVNEWLETSEGKRFRGLGGILLHKHYMVEEGDYKEAYSPSGKIYLGYHGTKKDVILPDWVESDPNPEKSARAPYGKHPKLLQWWGSDFRRKQDPLYWVKQWKAAIDPKAQIVLCTDMRFINEAQAVKEVGGYTFRVSRLNQDGTPFRDPSRPADHISETELDGYNVDYQVTVKTGDLALLDELAVTYAHYLRALKGHK